MSSSILAAAGTISISSAVMPMASISFHALDFVWSEVPKPGIVYPRIIDRSRPSRSHVFAATISAWVLSRPPEIPITMDFALVAVIRRINPSTWMLNAS